MALVYTFIKFKMNKWLKINENHRTEQKYINFEKLVNFGLLKLFWHLTLIIYLVEIFVTKCDKCY